MQVVDDMIEKLLSVTTAKIGTMVRLETDNVTSRPLTLHLRPQPRQHHHAHIQLANP